MRFGWSANDASVRVRWGAKVAALVLVAVYTLIYWFEPFSALWNIISTNMFLVIASSLTAAFATMIWSGYDPTDSPRRVWGSFAIGLWLWAAGELTWGYLNVMQGEVPIGLADVFWAVSYFFLMHALVYQYRIVARPTKQQLVSRTLIALLLMSVIYVIIYAVLTSAAESESKLDAAVNSFYPAADLLLVLIALWLARNFTGGAFSRPWLGLLAFAFADFLYAWTEISGVYSWGINQANLLSTITDVAYLGAYLILGLGVLSHWVFLSYGLRSLGDTR
ncbi:MAG TPA: hypothetical protein VK897_25285 [Anaerolineales bacterium]|nr:hypothetical protein [Anaerolineales bacterium]